MKNNLIKIVLIVFVCLIGYFYFRHQQTNVMRQRITSSMRSKDAGRYYVGILGTSEGLRQKLETVFAQNVSVISGYFQSPEPSPVEKRVLQIKKEPLFLVYDTKHEVLRTNDFNQLKTFLEKEYQKKASVQHAVDALHHANAKLVFVKSINPTTLLVFYEWGLGHTNLGYIKLKKENSIWKNKGGSVSHLSATNRVGVKKSVVFINGKSHELLFGLINNLNIKKINIISGTKTIQAQILNLRQEKNFWYFDTTTSLESGEIIGLTKDGEKLSRVTFN